MYNRFSVFTRLFSFFSVVSRGPQKVEEACEMYCRAANMFKMAKNWSGEFCFLKIPNLSVSTHLRRCGIGCFFPPFFCSVNAKCSTLWRSHKLKWWNDVHKLGCKLKAECPVCVHDIFFSLFVCFQLLEMHFARPQVSTCSCRTNMTAPPVSSTQGTLSRSLTQMVRDDGLGSNLTSVSIAAFRHALKSG